MNNIPEYVECIKGTGTAIFNVVGKIYKVTDYNPKTLILNINENLISNININLPSINNNTNYKSSTKEAYDAQNKLAAKTKTYREGLLQTDEEITAEQIDNLVEQAEISFREGLISVEKKLAGARRDVAKAEGAVKASELELTIAKRSKPEQLVQNIVNVKVKVDQSAENLSAARASQQKLQNLYEYLTTIQKELFS